MRGKILNTLVSRKLRANQTECRDNALESYSQ